MVAGGDLSTPLLLPVSPDGGPAREPERTPRWSSPFERRAAAAAIDRLLGGRLLGLFGGLAEDAQGFLGASLLAAPDIQDASFLAGGAAACGGAEDIEDLEAGKPGFGGGLRGRICGGAAASLAAAAAAAAAAAEAAAEAAAANAVGADCGDGGGGGEEELEDNERADVIVLAADKRAAAREREALPAERASVDDEEGALTVAEASYTMLNYLMNFGIFSVPLVFAQAGLAAGPLLVFFVAGACTFTARMLGAVFDALASAGAARPCYRGAALAAGGPWLAGLISATCLLELATYAWGNLIVLGHTLADLVPGLGFGQVAIGSTLLGVALSAIPDKAYSYVSLLSAICISTSCAIVLRSGWQLPAWAQGDRPLGEPSLLPTSLAMLIFTAACHPVLPSIFSNVRSRGDFDRATRNGWAIWAVFSVVFGAAVYYMFGDSVQVIVTRNIGKTLDLKPLPHARGLAALSAGWVSLKLQGAQVPVTRPFAEAFARACGIQLPRGNGGLLSALLSLPVLAAVGAGAYLLQDRIAVLEALAASLLMAINAFIFPAFAYLRICRPKGIGSKVGAFAAAAFGAGLSASVSLSYLR